MVLFALSKKSNSHPLLEIIDLGPINFRMEISKGRWWISINPPTLFIFFIKSVTASKAYNVSRLNVIMYCVLPHLNQCSRSSWTTFGNFDQNSFIGVWVGWNPFIIFFKIVITRIVLRYARSVSGTSNLNSLKTF